MPTAAAKVVESASASIGRSIRGRLPCWSRKPARAETPIRVDGALHEFTTIGDVVEDVTDIILNLKEVVLQAQASKLSYTVQIDKEGPGPVYARDIQLTEGLRDAIRSFFP